MNLQLKRHSSLMMLLVAIPIFAFSQTVADSYSIAWELFPGSDSNITARDGWCGYSVEAGLDLDRDGKREILFTLDETLAPGGPDPGHVDVYLYENDGDDNYTYVWGFNSPDNGNSMPGLATGDIDEDGLLEIYFGIPPAVGSNDNTWGTYIFEQDASGVFPTTPTLRYTHGYSYTDNYRPAGYQLADIDNDGDIELLSVDRGARRMQILSLATEGFDDLADFTIEYELGDTTLGGGGVYDLMVVDFDGDGMDEVWVNTWDMFSMAIVENIDTNEYALQVDLNQVFNDNDPGSFNLHDMFFRDIDGDGALEGWFPMTNGKLYYIDDVDSSVTEIDAASVIEVGVIGGSDMRGADLGDLNGDGLVDFVISNGTGETVNLVEYNGIGDPTDINSYVITELYSSVGGDADRWYPNSITSNDLDGDGFKEVIIGNRNASAVGQPAFVMLEYDPFNESPYATGWSNATNILHSDSEDTSFVKDYSGNSRTGIAGMDMDQDGIDEVILTDYVKGRVLVFEFNSVAGAFEMVWASPDVDSMYYANHPRTVAVGDLDGDGKQEIVFPSSSKLLPGWYIYEWDGVTGSDNYGTTYSSVNLVEIDTCCPGVPGAFRADHEAMTIFDVDGDGQEELISMIRRNSGGDRGTLIMSVDGDIEHNAGGSGLETWSAEYFLERGDYGGGSPYHSVPADLDGDGTYELVNHTWNYFNFYNIDATGTDSYAAADPASGTAYFQAAYPSDHVALFGGAAGDADGNGDDEAYFPNYYSHDLWVVDYEAGDDVLVVNGDHIVNVVNTLGAFGVSLFDIDGNGRDDIFVSTSFPKTISRTQLVGDNPDPRNPADYQSEIIYKGEVDLLRDIKTVTDENGAVTTTFSRSSAFGSKVQSHFNGEGLDFDGDGLYELFASFQSNVDSITTTTITWNSTSSKYDTIETSIVNDRSWVGMLFEFDETGGGVAEEMAFITPEDYKLLPNYPNPFNPVTNIDFVLPLDKKVSLKVYNVRGQLVRTLVNNKQLTKGDHHYQWNGLNDAGMKVASGVYIYSLEWGNFRKTKMMTLLK